MTRWKVNGREVDEEDVPYYLDESKYDYLKDDFEEDFNESNTASLVLWEYGGEDAYHEMFQEWIRGKIRYSPRYIEEIEGVSRVSASARSGTSLSKSRASGSGRHAASGSDKSKTTKKGRR